MAVTETSISYYGLNYCEHAEKDFADCDAVLTQLETTVEAVMATKELAQKYNKPFILNPAPYDNVPREIFQGIDFVTPNETEAEGFTGNLYCFKSLVIFPILRFWKMHAP